MCDQNYDPFSGVQETSSNINCHKNGNSVLTCFTFNVSLLQQNAPDTFSTSYLTCFFYVQHTCGLRGHRGARSTVCIYVFVSVCVFCPMSNDPVLRREGSPSLNARLQPVRHKMRQARCDREEVAHLVASGMGLGLCLPSKQSLYTSKFRSCTATAPCVLNVDSREPNHLVPRHHCLRTAGQAVSVIPS